MLLPKTVIRYILCFPLLLGWFSCFGQARGYILVGDTAYSEGYIKYNPRKPFTVEFQTSRKATSSEIYSPESLTEFGYRDSSRFVSREIMYFDEKRAVFLELVESGPLNLYKVRGRNGKQLYLEKDGLTLLSKKNLGHQLRAHITNAPSWQRQLASVKLSEPSLAYLVRNINKNRNARLPLFTFGPAVSLSLSTISIDANALPESMSGDITARSEHAEAGLFMEMPFWYVNNLSVLGQVKYGKMQFVHAQFKPEVDQDFKLDLEYVRTTLMPRYYLNANRVSLYLEAGADYAHMLRQSSVLLKAEHGNKTTTIHEYRDTFDAPVNSFGLNAGAGVQYLYRPKRQVSLSINSGRTFSERYAINHLSTTFRISI